ncbi:MAG: NAD(+) synthase, partial [Candidatus Bathyarchaeia archaeon]
MKLSAELLNINPQTVENAITYFVRDSLKKIKGDGIVLGVSGGVDSAVAVALSTRAIGKEKVLALFMPEEETRNEKDYKDIELLVEEFGFQLKTVDVTKPLDTLYDTIPNYDVEDRLSRGNLKARLRMM